MYDPHFIKDHISVLHVSDSGITDVTDKVMPGMMQRLAIFPAQETDAHTQQPEGIEGEQLQTLADPLSLNLSDFVAEFGDELLASLNCANPPVYTGEVRPARQVVLDGLGRRLFDAQADVVHAVTELLINQGERAAIVNGEMGCGKTCVGIATAAVMFNEGYRRTLVLSPPHLVYKWRREILETVPQARVWVLNGPDTLRKLMLLRGFCRIKPSSGKITTA